MYQGRHTRKSIRTVFEEFDQTHERTLALLARLSQEELPSLNHFDWTGKSWTVSDYLVANTANHYRWTRNKIRKW